MGPGKKAVIGKTLTVNPLCNKESNTSKKKSKKNKKRKKSKRKKKRSKDKKGKRPKSSAGRISMAPVRSGFGEKQAEGTMSNTSVHRPAGVPPLYPQPEKAVK